MLATLTDAPFDDPGWVFEDKFDGSGSRRQPRPAPREGSFRPHPRLPRHAGRFPRERSRSAASCGAAALRTCFRNASCRLRPGWNGLPRGCRRARSAGLWPRAVFSRRHSADETHRVDTGTYRPWCLISQAGPNGTFVTRPPRPTTSKLGRTQHRLAVGRWMAAAVGRRCLPRTRRHRMRAGGHWSARAGLHLRRAQGRHEDPRDTFVRSTRQARPKLKGESKRYCLNVNEPGAMLGPALSPAAMQV